MAPPAVRGQARVPAWIKPLSVAAVVGMVATIPLAWLAAGAGPVPHAALAVSAFIASVAAHVRRGGGGDLGASLALGLGVMLGVGVPDGVVGAGVHAAVAIAGVALSTWVHLGHLRRSAAQM
jgi:hypothetical protein